MLAYHTMLLRSISISKPPFKGAPVVRITGYLAFAFALAWHFRASRNLNKAQRMELARPVRSSGEACRRTSGDHTGALVIPEHFGLVIRTSTRQPVTRTSHAVPVIQATSQNRWTLQGRSSRADPHNMCLCFARQHGGARLAQPPWCRTCLETHGQTGSLKRSFGRRCHSQ
jgi:hypothetical protein